VAVSLHQLELLLNSEEDEHLEFKLARDGFDADELLKYCCALANEKSGKLILGITDKKPRQVVGTNAFGNLDKIKEHLSSLALRIEIDVLNYDGKRVLVFDIPSRPIGVPKKANNIYWARRGGSLTAMTEDMLQRIFKEADPDFSATLCNQAVFDDLSTEAIEEFRKRWQQKSGNASLSQLSTIQLLRDAELIQEDAITYAALVLFGKRYSLGRLLAHAEVIFEYRSKEIAGPANQREEFREGFFLYYDKLWGLINLRNNLQHYQDGLFMRDISTFSERSIREAILNAVSHRDYQSPGSVFIRQYEEYIRIESPGGFPPGITPDNILDHQMPRNRRIAETLAKCGLVERSGQGANRMFEESITQGKEIPDFYRSDPYWVILTLDGKVQNVDFLKFLEKMSAKRSQSFSSSELVVLDLIHKGKKPSEPFKQILNQLQEEGVVESAGRGKYILNRNYYTIAGQKGIYTRKKGLDRETNCQLLLKHIRENSEVGSKLNELMQVLPSLTMGQIQGLLKRLKKHGKIVKEGKTNAALWFPSSSENIRIDVI
jgi:ATP-dependent DNA helicase RecG